MEMELRRVIGYESMYVWTITATFAHCGTSFVLTEITVDEYIVYICIYILLYILYIIIFVLRKNY